MKFQKYLYESDYGNLEDDEILSKDSIRKIFDELDDSLTHALKDKKQQNKYNKPVVRAGENLLIIGAQGAAKTSTVEDWALQHPDITLVEIDAENVTLGDIAGLPRPSADGKNFVRLPAVDLTKLYTCKTPYCILYLDEFNRAQDEIIPQFMKIINNHILPLADDQMDDQSDDSKKWMSNISNRLYLPKMLFTVATINPHTKSDKTAKLLSGPQLRRFKQIFVKSERSSSFRYLEQECQERMNDALEEGDEEDFNQWRGRWEIAHRLLANSTFIFDDTLPGREDEKMDAEYLYQTPAYLDPENAGLSQRTLSAALWMCDGDKDKFLDLFQNYCGKNKYTEVKEILDNYENSWIDFDSPAINTVLNGTQSKLLKAAQERLHQQKQSEEGQGAGADNTETHEKTASEETVAKPKRQRVQKPAGSESAATRAQQRMYN